jgi:hypothetical protein
VILVHAVYVVSVALIVFQSAAIWILLPAINLSCLVANPSSTYFFVAGEPSYSGVYGV